MARYWKLIRERICPKRIYKMGTLGLSHFDDRTFKEKVCDWIDGYFNFREERKRTIVFRPFWDWSLGVYIRDKSDIKRIEKETGFEMVTIKDWERESKRQREIKDQDHLRKIEGQLKYVIHEVKQGRKFTQESAEKRRRICREQGITRLPGGATI